MEDNEEWDIWISKDDCPWKAIEKGKCNRPERRRDDSDDCKCELGKCPIEYFYLGGK